MSSRVSFTSRATTAGRSSISKRSLKSTLSTGYSGPTPKADFSIIMKNLESSVTKLYMGKQSMDYILDSINECKENGNFALSQPFLTDEFVGSFFEKWNSFADSAGEIESRSGFTLFSEFLSESLTLIDNYLQKYISLSPTRNAKSEFAEETTSKYVAQMNAYSIQKIKILKLFASLKSSIEHVVKSPTKPSKQLLLPIQKSSQLLISYIENPKTTLFYLKTNKDKSISRFPLLFLLNRVHDSVPDAILNYPSITDLHAEIDRAYSRLSEIFKPSPPSYNIHLQPYSKSHVSAVKMQKKVSHSAEDCLSLLSQIEKLIHDQNTESDKMIENRLICENDHLEDVNRLLQEQIEILTHDDHSVTSLFNESQRSESRSVDFSNATLKKEIQKLESEADQVRDRLEVMKQKWDKKVQNDMTIQFRAEIVEKELSKKMPYFEFHTIKPSTISLIPLDHTRFTFDSEAEEILAKREKLSREFYSNETTDQRKSQIEETEFGPIEEQFIRLGKEYQEYVNQKLRLDKARSKFDTNLKKCHELSISLLHEEMRKFELDRLST